MLSMAKRLAAEILDRVGLVTLNRPPVLVRCRCRPDVKTAVVFVHGFGGHPGETWGQFPDFIAADPRLAGWDIVSIGYMTALRLDLPGLWASDPDLTKLSLYLRTALTTEPLTQYRCIALVAHSMGGLIAQAALLDAEIARRTGHVFLFGVPSAGLDKALLGRALKRQVRDMLPQSDFITKLRGAWPVVYDDGRRFTLKAVAGDVDEFVPASSSHEPFPESVRAVVPGDHLSMVKPTDPHQTNVGIVVEELLGRPRVRNVIDSAQLQLERQQFREIEAALRPRVKELDDDGLVLLALALDGLDRSGEALKLLERRYRGGLRSTDALGVLAGRHKRQWLVGRREADLRRARELYNAGLVQAESAGDRAQAYYHAINIAFLGLMAVPPSSAVPQSALDTAARAIEHCNAAPTHVWKFATIGEAQAIIGDLNAACAAYEEALKMHPSPREIDSIHSQAVLVVARVFGDKGLKRLATVFEKRTI